jgi:protoporphyrin/coproporphyrin ferrochelatase
VPSQSQPPTAGADPKPYDALLLVSFGGPERRADVLPFLANVTGGRGIPPDRLAEVADHYYGVGGRSPINDQCRALIEAVRADFDRSGLDLPIYWGNRNWHPFLADTLQTMADDGIRRAACFVTSAYASYSGCRQYRENLFEAAVAVTGQPPRLDRLRHYYNHPGFVSAFVDSTVAALRRLPAESQPGARLVFVTHSLPTAMAATSGPRGGAYVAQHLEAARLVAAGVAGAVGHEPGWELVYCSRSGSPRTPWLEPDVNDHLERLAGEGAGSVVVIPLGFVSDHMEVLYDLDTEAAATAARLGLRMQRAAAPGTSPGFVAMLRELLLERARLERGEPVERRALGRLGVPWDVCPAGCCPNPAGPRPAVGGADSLLPAPLGAPACDPAGIGAQSPPGTGTN